MPTPRTTNRRTTTSLYLDDVDVSILNGALHRATGGEPGRASDLIVFLQEHLAHIVAAEPSLAKGYSPSLTEVAERRWWRLTDQALETDLPAYADAWQEIRDEWAPAHVAPIGAELIALSALTHRSTAWRLSPPETKRERPFPFGTPEMLYLPNVGPYPRTFLRAHAEQDAQDRSHLPHLPGTFAVFRRNQLAFVGQRTATPFSVATHPNHHELSRSLLGPAVIDWLIRHWARRFRDWQVERWTDAPLYAAMHAAASDDYGWMPDALDELEMHFKAYSDLRPHALDKYGPRILEPQGATRAERLADAFDVAFVDVIDVGGFFLADLEMPLEHLGVIVLAKRLGLLAAFDETTFEPKEFGRALRQALGIEAGADHGTWRDVALGTVPDVFGTIDGLRRYGAAAVHADAILHAYLTDRADERAPRGLLALLGRSRPIAWPDRWALHRFIGIPVSATPAELQNKRRGTVRLGSIDTATWSHMNQVLAHLGSYAEGTTSSPLRELSSSDTKARGAYELDAAFLQAALRFTTEEERPHLAARKLATWMRKRARAAEPT